MWTLLYIRLLSCVGIALIVLGATLTDRASGEQIELENPVSQLITSPNDISRALVNPGNLQSLENRLVTSARLVLPGPAQVLESDIDVIVAPVARSWINGAATWTIPWETPGGDVLMDYAQLTQVPKGVSLEKVSEPIFHLPSSLT